MDEADFEFINNMVEQLDVAIQHLVLEEERMMAKLGRARAEELSDYWQDQMDAEERKEFSRTLDHGDKMLLYIWSRLKRAHLNRAQAGHAIMQQKNIPKTTDK